MYEQQFNPYGSNLSIVKGFFKSGKVLTIGILYIVSVVLTIIMNTTTSINVIIKQIIDFCNKNNIDVPEEARQALLNSTGASSAYTIGSIIGASIIPVLSAIAFFIMFAKSRNASEDSSPIAGITIMHVLAIISLILTIIGVVVIFIFYIIGFIAAMAATKQYSSSHSYGSSVTGGVTVLLVLAGIILVAYAFITIFYAVSCKNFYRSAKRSITTSDLENKGAVPYGVFNIILAVFSFISLIISLVSFSRFTGAGIIICSNVVTILLQIFTAIFALSYNKYINNQKNGVNTIPYGGAPYNPAPAQAAPPYNTPNYDYANPQSQAPYTDNPEPVSAPRPQAMFCPICGAKTEPDAPFCPNCGKKL